MNTYIIADSSALVSLISETDKNHKIALGVVNDFKETSGSIIVPCDVFSETINVVGKKIGQDIAIAVAQEITESGVFIVMESSENLRQQALSIFKKQPASVSFTDCVVMSFADKFETKAIFGFDETFKKNGYLRLGFDKTGLST